MADTLIVETEAPTSSAVSWPAIIAGGVVAFAMTLLLLALGTGLGFSVVSPWRGAPDVSTTKAAAVAGIFTVVTAVMSSALGGYIAGRLRTRWPNTTTDEVFFRDTAHGFVAWAFATVMGAAFLASAATFVAGSAAAGASQGVAQRAEPTDAWLDRLFRPTYGGAGGGPAATGVVAGRDLAADRAVARNLLPGLTGTVTGTAAEDRQYIVQMVSARTGLPQAEAERRVAAIEVEARQAADTARRISMQLSFWLVASMFFGALAACLTALEGGKIRDGRG